MLNIGQDLRYGARMLWKNPGFTLVAVLSLALGIGANSALFSLVDAVLLRMLPVHEPERLVLFDWRSGEKFRTGGMRGTFVGTEPGTRGASMFQLGTLNKLRAEQAKAPDSPLSDLFAYAPLYEMTVVFQQQAEIVSAQGVTGNYYAGLGVRAAGGRLIQDSDDNASAVPVAVLSHHYWMKSFGGNLSVIGQQITLNQKPFTIVGVSQAGFVGALQVDARPDITVPIAFEPLLLGENSAAANKDRGELWYAHLMGRLKPGATFAQARDSLNGTFQSLALDSMPAPRREKDIAKDKLDAKEYPRLRAQSGAQGAMEIRSISSKTIFVLFAVVAFVLLIACANVANLLLARAALRGPEISVRLAVGAGRWRLVRQLLTESVLLSALGGLIGVLFAVWGKAGLMALATRNGDFLPKDIELQLNGRVLLFTFGISLLTGIVFGLVPAWRATSLDLNSALKQSKRSAPTVSRLSKGLIVAQVALSLLLLVGAGLFIRTLRNLESVDVGFNQENLLLFELAPRQNGYQEERLVQFYEQLFARFDNLPGVGSATFAVVPLIAYNTWNTSVLLPGETEKAGGEHMANRQMARENYFATMEIPLLSGRIFTAQDDSRAPKVAIVNQTFANKYFPNQSVLGKRITDNENQRELEIVGVVKDTKYSNQREEIEPLMFTPWRQELDNVGRMHFAFRTMGEPTLLANSVQQIVRELDSNLPVTNIKTQRLQASENLTQERVYARLLSFFGVLALLLAAIGLSGVLAYSVAQRTQEIGIRMALGAQPANVLRLVIGQGMKLVILGIVTGGLGGYILKRVMQSYFMGDRRSWQHQIAEMMYGVKATDPLTLTMIALLLLAVALFACWLPARRASQVDPLVALRHE